MQVGLDLATSLLHSLLVLFDFLAVFEDWLKLLAWLLHNLIGRLLFQIVNHTQIILFRVELLNFRLDQIQLWLEVIVI